MTTQVQPQDKTVTANGHSLHYLDWGAVGKPVALLVHGLRGHAHSWDDVSAALCEDYHVLAMDQRGRGDSDWAKDGDYTTGAYVADLTGFCQALGLEKFILVGHSMGGRNSLAFGGENPQMLEKLVVVDVGPTLDPRGSQRISQEIQNVPEEFDSFEAVLEYQNRQNRFASEAVMRRRVALRDQRIAQRQNRLEVRFANPGAAAQRYGASVRRPVALVAQHTMPDSHFARGGKRYSQSGSSAANADYPAQLQNGGDSAGRPHGL